MHDPPSPVRFSDLGLPDFILERLDSLGFVTPTPIQEQAIPPLLDNYDVVGIAQTGTGKTLAFALPMIACHQPGDLGLVVAPTRELAEQIEETFQMLGVSSTLLIGGAPMEPQIQGLRNTPDFVVATPGRLLDHVERNTIDLRCVTMLVLDEADRMLDMGFAPDINKIVANTEDDRQTMLFSATMPKEIEKMAKRFLYQPVRIEIARTGSTAKDVEQELIIVPQERKMTVLKKLIRDQSGSVLVFTKTKIGARRLTRQLMSRDFSTAEIHSDLDLDRRRMALDGFKRGAFQVLVATDIAARGLDVDDIGLVVNFDVPNNPEDYVHRIGRTGRAGKSGHAVTIASPDQEHDIKDIEKLLQTKIPLSDLSDGGFSIYTSGGSRPRGNNSPRGGGRGPRGGGSDRPTHTFRKKRAKAS
jgi:ATP-dependent RNA helicase RhlE